VKCLTEREALGVEFKNAFVQVDFEEIEEFKEIALEWHQLEQKKKNIKATA
jgi:hypothetical protein